MLLKKDYVNEIKVSFYIKYGSSAKRGVDFRSDRTLSCGSLMSLPQESFALRESEASAAKRVAWNGNHPH